MTKTTTLLGTAFACIIAVFFLFSTAGELRDKWNSSRSFGRFVLSMVGVSFGAPSSGYAEYWASYQQASKTLGASGKTWVSMRYLPYSSTEDFLRKCLQLKAATERLDADTQRLASVCNQAKQHERDWVRSKADRFRIEICGVSVPGYASLVALQRQQLSAIEDASAGWSSGSLANLERTAQAHEPGIQGQFKALLTALSAVLERSAGKGAPYEAYDIRLIRPKQ